MVESYIEYIKNLLAVVVLAVAMLVRSIVMLPMHLLCWIGKHSLAILIAVDLIMATVVILMMRVTHWSFWGHW